MYKKIIALLLAMLLLVSSLAGCGRHKDNGVLDIVCTVFPVYDWVMNVLGDVEEGVSVKLLVKNGVDAHSYQPTFEDVAAITDCDLLLRVGGESEKWLDDVLTGHVNQNMKQVLLMDLLRDELQEEAEESLFEGETTAEAETEDEREQKQKHIHGHEDLFAYDEHIWLSVKHARVLTAKIADLLKEELPEHKEKLDVHAMLYDAQLEKLDADYQSAVAAGNRQTLIFADRFPFCYLFEDYGLQYYAAFSGCSAETEASFATVKFLAEQLQKTESPYVLILENGNQALAETVIANSKRKNTKILVLDSLQSYVATSDAPSYLDVMRSNLAVLKKAMA